MIIVSVVSLALFIFYQIELLCQYMNTPAPTKIQCTGWVLKEYLLSWACVSDYLFLINHPFYAAQLWD